MLSPGASQALGIESLQSIFPDKESRADANALTSAGRKKLQDAEDSFQSSELLKRLKEQTATNSKKYYTALPLCISCIHDVSIPPKLHSASIILVELSTAIRSNTMIGHQLRLELGVQEQDRSSEQVLL